MATSQFAPPIRLQRIIVGTADLDGTDLAKIDGITDGTGAANKALVLDASLDITAGLRSLTLTNGNLSAGSGAVAGGRLQTATSAVAFSGSLSPTPYQIITRTATGITDAVATSVMTVTIPNQQNSCSFELLVTGHLGAGGAIGAGEAIASNKYMFSVTRTAGVATVVNVSSAYGATAAAVAGAATCTCTAAAGAVAGAVGATQTFPITVTITKSGGSSAAHVARMVISGIDHQTSSGISIT